MRLIPVRGSKGQATDVGDIRAILAPDNAALLTAPNDPHSLGEALATLAADPGLRARLGAAAGAVELAPADAYPLYNRGRARLALGQIEQARADFTAAAGPAFKQPKARKLAREALDALP